MKIKNQIMLGKLSGADERKYYHYCLDISLADENYKVKSVAFFARDADNPAKDFVCVRECEDSFAVLIAETDDPGIISEGTDFLLSLNAAENQLWTNYGKVLSLPCVTGNFDVFLVNEPAPPTYSAGSLSELTDIPTPEDVTISLLEDGFPENLLSGLEIDTQYFNRFIDIRRYLLIKEGKPVGYLRAERGYRNYYDIGWLFVKDSERGHGYASALVSYYAKDMVKNGFIPNYGTAVSEGSEKTAEKCGFSRDDGYKFRRPLIRRK